MDDGREDGPAIEFHRRGIDLDIADLAGSEPVTEVEIVTLLAKRVLAFERDLIGGQYIDLIDVHSRQAFRRIAVIGRRSTIRGDDLPVRRIDQQHDQAIILKESSESGFTFGQRLLGSLALGDVELRADVIGDVSLFVPDNRDGKPCGIELAILAAVPDFSLPRACTVDGVPHGPIKRRIVTPG